VRNGISQSFQRYLAAGGLGVLVGDGALPHPGDEQIIEAYYAFRPVGWASMTVDYQHIANPGYNRDRGPANVVGLRLHAGF
jgi:high affinity Mn2+ porin